MKIPIIATTANAIQGDIERCLLAGMNDYIAKPISYDDLAFKVEKWILRGHRAIDPAAIARLQQLAAKGNLKLLEELIELFGQDSPDALQKMRDFLDAQDFPRLSQKAHTLKSSAANIGALRLRDLCERIERVRPEVGIQNISGLIDSAEREFRLALEELYLLRKT
jgi:HPt (histidine-containing phosphotransfer) domain-containing protein